MRFIDNRISVTACQIREKEKRKIWNSWKIAKQRNTKYLFYKNFYTVFNAYSRNFKFFDCNTLHLIHVSYNIFQNLFDFCISKWKFWNYLLVFLFCDYSFLYECYFLYWYKFVYCLLFLINVKWYGGLRGRVS